MPSEFIKPMLAKKIELKDIKLPCIVQEKLDGIRCIANNGYVQTRSGKEIPNLFIREMISTFSRKYPTITFDGEIISGNTCNETTSNVMSMDGEPWFTYNIFDVITNYEDAPQTLRLDILDQLKIDDQFVRKVQSKIIRTREELDNYNELMMVNHEGFIIRYLFDKYNHGRGKCLFKYKYFEDDEATIIGFEELMINNNEHFINESGHSVRSSRADGLIAGDTLGSL